VLRDVVDVDVDVELVVQVGKIRGISECVLMAR
jgi:hypothetical protein